ncbi:acyl carrier protein [Streptomyces sp. NPDC001709]
MLLDELKGIMRQSGVEDSVDLDGDILDRSWTELGYDSLAVLEITTEVQHRTGVDLPEEENSELTTPRLLLEHVSGRNRGA